MSNTSEYDENGWEVYPPNKKKREYAPGELSCPVTGCTLGKDHNGPCMDRFGGEGTIEIRERNLMLLMEDDPEGFRRRVRELLALASEGKGE